MLSNSLDHDGITRYTKSGIKNKAEQGRSLRASEVKHPQSTRKPANLSLNMTESPTDRHTDRQTDGGVRSRNSHVLHTTSAATMHMSFPLLKLPSTKRLHPTRFFVKASPQAFILWARLYSESRITGQHRAAQDRTAQDRTTQGVQYSTGEHRGAQGSTAQGSTAQHSTAQRSAAQ